MFINRQDIVRNKAVKRIYVEAFAREDRMPFWLMQAMIKRQGTQLLEYCEEDAVVGFVYLAYDEKLVFITYLAVDAKRRSKGVGSALLQEVKKAHPGKKIILSIEPCPDRSCSKVASQHAEAGYTDDLLGPRIPNKEQRLRRKAFYLRNNYAETGHLIKLGGKWQELLILGAPFDGEELQEFFVKYSNGTMRPKIKKRVSQKSDL